METVEVAPVSIFRPMEITPAALDEAGIDSADAVKGYCLLIGFTMCVRSPTRFGARFSTSKRGRLFRSRLMTALAIKGKERLQGDSGLAWRFLGKEVPSRDWSAAYVVGPSSP